MALTVTLIESTDTLESGFRAKSNANFNSIVVDGKINVDGNLVLQSANGNIEVPLSDTFATKGYAAGVSSTPPASETTSGRARFATDAETIAGTNDSTIVTPLKLLVKLEDYFSKATHLADASDEINIGNNSSLTQTFGRFGILNTNNFLGEFSVTDLTANRIATLPDRDIEINKWADLSGVPPSFTPTAHFHEIGDVNGLSVALSGKQPLNANLTSLGQINSNGIVRRTGVNTFGVGTNDPITLTGDVTGTGTTNIATTLSPTGVTAGTYRSVTVDAKGRVTAGSVPNYNAEWDSRWDTKIDDFIEFGSDIQINGGLGVIGSLFVGGNLFDKDSSTGTANQVLMPVAGGVAWTSLSTAQISNFSANVLGQVLTGLGAGSNTPITSSNTILTGFQDLQAQINVKANALSGTTNYLPKFTSSTGIGNSTIFNDGAFVGIGTATPTQILHVKSAGNAWQILERNSVSNISFLQFTTLSTSDFGIGVIDADSNFGIFNYGTDNNSIKILKSNGNVGVNTDPLAKLHLYTTTGTFPVLRMNSSFGGANYVDINPFIVGIANQGFDVRLNGVSRFTIENTNGYIGINTTSPVYRLDVNGTARFTDVVQFDSIAKCSLVPTAANDLVNKAFVESLTFLKRGETVKTISLTTLTKSGLYAVNGYTLTEGDLVLDAGGTSGGGVWVASSGAWSRSTLNNTDTEIRGAYHYITNGTYANSRYINTNTTTITLDSTAITYDVDFGAETDPVWNAYKTANDLTPTRFGNWNTAFGWGNHANLYVDKTSAQSDIAGAKKFTTSIQSPIAKFGTDSINLSTVNAFGNTPRIASTGVFSLFSATGDFSWSRNGELTMMRLTGSGLRVGDSGTAAYMLDVLGNAGFTGLLSFGRPSVGLAMSSGTVGQFLRRSQILNGYGTYSDVNNWANILVADISDIATYYQAKITGTENYVTKKTASNFGDSQIFDNGTSVVIGGTTAIDSSKFSVIGKIGATTARIGDDTDGINIGSLAINSTGTLNYGATSHVWNVSSTEKMNLNDSRLALTGNFELTGKLKVNGSFGLDHYFLKTLGVDGGGVPLGTEWAVLNCGEISDISDLYVSKTFADANYIKRVTDEGERGFFLYGDTNNTVKEGFMFTNPDTGIMGIHAYRLSGTTIEQYGFQLDKDGLPYWLFADGSRKRILTTNDAVGGGGTPTSYTLAEPLYFVGSQINVRTASSTQAGVLSNTKFGEFDAKLGQGSTVNTHLNFANGSTLYFERYGSSTEARGKIFTSNVDGGVDRDFVIQAFGIDTNLYLQSSSSIIARASNTSNPAVMGVEVDLGANLANSSLKFNGTNFNFKTNITPTDGQKFVVQYDSSKNTFFFVPM